MIITRLQVSHLKSHPAGSTVALIPDFLKRRAVWPLLSWIKGVGECREASDNVFPNTEAESRGVLADTAHVLNHVKWNSLKVHSSLK